MTVNRRSVPVLATFLAIVAVVAACSGGSGPLGSVPSVSSSPDPSVAQGSPDATPEPSADESGTRNARSAICTAGDSGFTSVTMTSPVEWGRSSAR